MLLKTKSQSNTILIIIIFHPLYYNIRRWSSTPLHHIHSAEANICKYGPEQPWSCISGGSISFLTWMRSPLFACSLQSLSGTRDKHSPKKITLMAGENRCLQLQNKVLVIHAWWGIYRLLGSITWLCKEKWQITLWCKFKYLDFSSFI